MPEELPRHVADLFWDVDPRRISLERDLDFVLGRVLSSGGLRSIQWLRARVGDDAIRSYLERTRGRKLGARQLRFWELVLDLARPVVDDWLGDEARRVWERRAG
ncbi:MAG: hypothetical protein JXR96_17160 [Deltaproteobacteria bacterium]|nr:hypothetical protein [Deltaproteobacteria bacterium]